MTQSIVTSFVRGGWQGRFSRRLGLPHVVPQIVPLIVK